MLYDGRFHMEVTCIHQGPFLLTWFTAWINNYTHFNVWDEITDLFLNVIGATVEF